MDPGVTGCVLYPTQSQRHGLLTRARRASAHRCCRLRRAGASPCCSGAVKEVVLSRNNFELYDRKSNFKPPFHGEQPCLYIVGRRGRQRKTSARLDHRFTRFALIAAFNLLTLYLSMSAFTCLRCSNVGLCICAVSDQAEPFLTPRQPHRHRGMLETSSYDGVDAISNDGNRRPELVSVPASPAVARALDFRAESAITAVDHRSGLGSFSSGSSGAAPASSGSAARSHQRGPVAAAKAVRPLSRLLGGGGGGSGVDKNAAPRAEHRAAAVAAEAGPKSADACAASTAAVPSRPLSQVRLAFSWAFGNV